MQPRLAVMQNLLCRLITAPNGVEEGLIGEKNLPPKGIGALVGGDLRLSATERLEIYANMYFYRLLDAIKEDFPATFTTLGEVNFHNLITGYLVRYPPGQPSITEASRHLPEFVDDSPVLQSKPFVADLIRLERASIEVFLGPDQSPLTIHDLRAIPAPKWSSLRISIHPAIRLLDCEWRVDKVLHAVEQGQSVPAPDREAKSIIVWRKNCVVSYRALDEVERSALAAIRRGDEFRLVCEVIAAKNGEAATPALTSQMLSRWLGDGVLVRV